jgi:hypothetical protein
VPPAGVALEERGHWQQVLSVQMIVDELEGAGRRGGRRGGRATVRKEMVVNECVLGEGAADSSDDGSDDGSNDGSNDGGNDDSNDDSSRNGRVDSKPYTYLSTRRLAAACGNFFHHPYL